MKGGGSSYTLPAKGRWRRVIGVLVLVVLSMLLPLAFLLSLHNGLLSTVLAGISFEQQSSIFDGLPGLDESDASNTRKEWENDNSEQMEIILNRMGKVKPENVVTDFVEGTENVTTGNVPKKISQQTPGFHAPPDLPKLNRIPAAYSASGNHSEATGETTSNVVEESEDSCNLKYGSYCLWRRRPREEMKDSMVNKLKYLLLLPEHIILVLLNFQGREHCHMK